VGAQEDPAEHVAQDEGLAQELRQVRGEGREDDAQTDETANRGYERARFMFLEDV